MHFLVVYCHPSHDSFTWQMYRTVLNSLQKNNHSYETSDLYAMNFQSDMSESEYLREAYYKKNQPVPEDVALEQEKLRKADGIIFVFPVFWTEMPSKLVGWFDRVWTVGFAYEPCEMPHFKKVLFLACAGNSVAHLKETGLFTAMEKIFCLDRINSRAESAELHVFEGMSRGMETREKFFNKHLEQIEKIVEEL